MMSADNVEVVRAAYRAFMKGDLQGLGEYFAEQIEWETPDSLPLVRAVRKSQPARERSSR
jgi:ketosteroid isomerase-like protein